MGRNRRFNYAELISIALNSEVGRDPNRVKLIANWTGADERTVLNWLTGISGPKGEYLVYLLRKSDAVYETIMSLAQRQDALEHHFSKQTHNHHIIYPSSSKEKVGERAFSDPNVPNGVPDVPIDDPEFDDMHLRHNWFLQCLRRKPKAGSRDIKEFFGVSLKTAKRDIASLKAENKIIFKGNKRKGRYVLLDSSYQPP
jgi:hypothetical protein